MEERRTSVFENGLIWFGAAVSIAEILTGKVRKSAMETAKMSFGSKGALLCCGRQDEKKKPEMR